MVDRADPLSRAGLQRKAAPTTGPTPAIPRFRTVLAVIACLELAWLGWYLVVPLPNVPNVTIRRGLLLLKTFPEVIPRTSFRQSMLGKGLSELSHVENLPQRVPVVLAAALIAGAAIGLGDTILGRLKLRSRLRPPEWLALSYGLGAAVARRDHADRRPHGMAGSLVHPTWSGRPGRPSARPARSSKGELE